jgi:DNA-binding PadR family transcriptional regulator
MTWLLYSNTRSNIKSGLRHMMQRMARQGRDDDGLARFGEPGMLVLLSVSDGPKHGYAITADVLEQTGIRLGPGTLYGSLVKLVERGLVAALPSQDRRRPYEITEAGRTALAKQLASWSRVVDMGRARVRSA